MDIGTRIKLEREHHGWTQEELASRCGYKNKASISKIESSGDNVTSKKVKVVAAALGVSAGYIMGWESYKDMHVEDDSKDDLDGFYDELHLRPEMKMLFKSARKASKEQIESIVKMLESFGKE